MKIRSPLVHIQGPTWMCSRPSHFFNHQLSCLQSDFVMCDGQFGKRKHWSLRGNFHSWSTSILLFWFNYTHDEELLRPCSPCTWPSGPFDWWTLLPTVSVNLGDQSHHNSRCRFLNMTYSEVLLACVGDASRPSLYFAEDMQQHDDAHI